MAKDKMKLDEVIKDFNKKFKEELVHDGLSQYDYDRILFTSPRLNYMSFGGIPMGKLIEFYGEEHGGKTTTAMDIVANYQIRDDAKIVLWVDCENTFDTVWASKIGVDVDAIKFFTPSNQSSEVIFQFVLDAINTGEVGLVVIDSFGVMISQQAYDKDLTEKTYAGISKSLTDFGARAVGLCNKHKCTVIGINQLREDFNSMYGGTKTVGGRGWKHDVTARFEFRRGNFIDDRGEKLTRGAENPAGNIVDVVMTKNKTCAPTRRRGWYTLRYLDGIDYIADLIEVAIKYGIVDKSGAWFSVVNIDTGEILAEKIHGQNKLSELLSEDDEILGVVEQLIADRINSDEVQSAEELLDEDVEE